MQKRVLGRGPFDRCKRARGGVTGDLPITRNQALARITAACENYGAPKANMAKRWEVLYNLVVIGAGGRDMA